MGNLSSPMIVLLLWTAAAVAGEARSFRIPEDDPNENSDTVRGVAWSPDGETIAAGYGRFIGLLQKSRPGQAILWDVRTGGRRLTMTGYRDGVSSVAFSPDGKTLATSGYLAELKLWDLRTGTVRHAIDTPGVIEKVVFSPDGTSVAAGIWITNEDRTAGEAKIWRATTGEETSRFTGHAEGVRCLAFSPDGKLLATGSMYESVRIWDVKAQRLLATVNCPKVIELAWRKTEPILAKRGKVWTPMPWVNSVAFSPDGRTLAAAFGEPILSGVPGGVGVVQLWDTEKGQPIGTVPHDDTFVAQVAYSRDGRLIAIAGHGPAVSVRDARTYKEVARVQGAAPIAFSPNGGELLVRTGGNVLGIVSVRKTKTAD